MQSPCYTVPEAQGAGLEHSFLLLCLEELSYKTQVAQGEPLTWEPANIALKFRQ